MIDIAMIPRTDEPMEGVVFDVQHHTRRTGSSGPIHMGIWLAQNSMGLKSPSDGCWMAEAGQRYDEPLQEKKEGRSTQDTLAEPGLGGITHCRWMFAFDGQDVTWGS